jgi:Transcription factor WhiB
MAACLSYAVATDERYGVWGGSLPNERRAMRWREIGPSARSFKPRPETGIQMGPDIASPAGEEHADVSRGMGANVFTRRVERYAGLRGAGPLLGPAADPCQSHLGGCGRSAPRWPRTHRRKMAGCSSSLGTRAFRDRMPGPAAVQGDGSTTLLGPSTRTGPGWYVTSAIFGTGRPCAEQHHLRPSPCHDPAGYRRTRRQTSRSPRREGIGRRAATGDRRRRLQRTPQHRREGQSASFGTSGRVRDWTLRSGSRSAGLRPRGVSRTRQN